MGCWIMRSVDVIIVDIVGGGAVRDVETQSYSSHEDCPLLSKL